MRNTIEIPRLAASVSERGAIPPHPKRTAPDPAMMMIVVVALACIGITLITSASAELVGSNSEAGWKVWLNPSLRPLLFVPPALFMMWVASHVPYTFWRLRRRVWLSPIVWLMLLTVVALVLVLKFGVTINGARRWFRLGWISVQPSEVAKLALVVTLAAVMADRRFDPTLFDKFHRPPMTPRRVFAALLVLALCALTAWLVSRNWTLRELAKGVMPDTRGKVILGGLGVMVAACCLGVLNWTTSSLGLRWAWSRMHWSVAPLLALAGSATLLVVKEDFGTAALLVGVTAMVMLAGGMSKVLAGVLTLPAGAAAALFVFLVPYRLARVTDWWAGGGDPQGGGFHVRQSLMTIASGGWFGVGLGNGIQKFGYLPEDTTDFIFPILCEEMGIVGGFMVIGLFVVLLWQLGRTMRSAPDRLGQLIVLGTALVIGLQAAMNIAVVTGAVPPKGIALPFVSAGGSGLLVLSVMLGLSANVARRARLGNHE